ncbi:HNH endonuclease [Xanthomonas phage DMF5-T1]|nr:HNH endonuclease [Xanthomonas phage DMF5-T1]
MSAEHLPGACKLFAGAKHRRTGHGLKWYQGRLWYAHRLAAHLALGVCPPGLGCLHKCGTASCVNAGHLYYGDQRQNNQDVKKQRGIYRKLNQAQADSIRVDTRSMRVIAKDYNISSGMVSHIKAGRQWQT